MRNPTLRRSLLVAVFAAVGAGGCSTSISADDYDRSCEVDNDCVAVTEGERCLIERCGCPFTAINAADADQYAADLESLVCTDPFNHLGPVCLCIESVAVCDSGTCVSVRVPEEEIDEETSTPAQEDG